MGGGVVRYDVVMVVYVVVLLLQGGFDYPLVACTPSLMVPGGNCRLG